jgi:catechol 2,3-dioxygenase-like lactoylglutathione lyase family enzyme
MELMLHHVSIVTTDLERAIAFYSDVFELDQMERPPFPIGGVWFSCGAAQVHLVHHPEGTFRERRIDNNDGHFAFRTDDFEGFVARLEACGFRADAEPDDPKRMLLFRNGAAGFGQVYLLDPDRNIIEINAAPLAHG